MKNTERGTIKALKAELQEANETIAALRSTLITSLTSKDKELAETREKLRIAISILQSCGFGEDALDRYS